MGVNFAMPIHELTWALKALARKARACRGRCMALLDQIRLRRICQGKCSRCGERVYHSYPWRDQRGTPMHEDCAKAALFRR